MGLIESNRATLRVGLEVSKIERKVRGPTTQFWRASTTIGTILLSPSAILVCYSMQVSLNDYEKTFFLYQARTSEQCLTMSRKTTTVWPNSLNHQRKNSIEIVRRLDQAISIEPVINEGELDGFTCTMSFARPAKVEHQELRHVLSYESHNEVTRHLLKYWAGRAIPYAGSFDTLAK